LQPYANETLRLLAGRGVKSVDVICPGFAADCLETLEEIQVRSAELFIQCGGDSLRYIPALNTSAEHIALLAALVEHETQNWF
jgi:ferrochelatase